MTAPDPDRPAPLAEALGVLRHALASSLSGASLQLAVARLRLARERAPRPDEALRRAEEEVARGTGLLEALRALAGLAAERDSALDLAALCEAAAARARLLVPGGPVRLELERTGDPPPAHGPRTHVEEAVVALCRLALESPGTSRLTLRLSSSGLELAFDGPLPAAPDRLFLLGPFPAALPLFLAHAALGRAGARIEAAAGAGTALRVAFEPPS